MALEHPLSAAAPRWGCALMTLLLQKIGRFQVSETVAGP